MGADGLSTATISDSNLAELRPPAVDRPLAARSAVAKRAFDVAAAAVGLAVTSPLLAVLAAAVKLDSGGPVFFRCRRVGRWGRELDVLKLRKMRHDAVGAPLTELVDPRFTRLGRFLVKVKLDELPQLWNVLRGEMSLVGPRPEDARYVSAQADAYEAILTVRPGVTGLSQLAFAKESVILDRNDREADYLGRVLPQKVALDLLYVSRGTFAMDLRILSWTAVAVILRREVAVDRRDGRLGLRRRPCRIPAED